MHLVDAALVQRILQYIAKAGHAMAEERQTAPVGLGGVGHLADKHICHTRRERLDGAEPEPGGTPIDRLVNGAGAAVLKEGARNGYVQARGHAILCG